MLSFNLLMSALKSTSSFFGGFVRWKNIYQTLPFLEKLQKRRIKAFYAPTHTHKNTNVIKREHTHTVWLFMALWGRV